MQRVNQLYLFFMLSIVLLGFSTCTDDNTKMISPESTGTQGRVMIVMAKDKWNAEPGNAVREVFEEEMLGMPQPEASFVYNFMPLDAFSALVKRERNLFLVSIGDHIEKSNISVKYNKWSNPQIVITVQARNIDEFIELLGRNAEVIRNRFIAAERDRLVSTYKNLTDPKIRTQLSEKYKLKLAVPAGYKLDVSDTGFVWLSQETPTSTQGILIWEYSYSDTAAFNLNNLVYIRDSITMHNVPGPKEGSFMTTEKIMQPIHYKESMLNNRYTVEMRGLWKTEGAFLGGPFVSYTTVDTIRNRVVTVDGFVYGGKKTKRNLIRQVEAILTTLEFEP